MEKTKPGDRVGIVGIGGLGHFALQFAAAMGCEVTAFSTSPGKEEEARAFGAHHFVVSKDADAMKKQAGRFDMVLSAVTADLPWEQYLALIKPRGQLCIVGASPGNIEVPPFWLIMGSRAVSGSQIGSPSGIAKMLEIAGLNGVKPQIEKMAMKDVNDALEKVRAGKARYRVVLEL